jgi:hypothetical protein
MHCQVLEVQTGQQAALSGVGAVQKRGNEEVDATLGASANLLKGSRFYIR